MIYEPAVARLAATQLRLRALADLEIVRVAIGEVADQPTDQQGRGRTRGPADRIGVGIGDQRPDRAEDERDGRRGEARSRPVVDPHQHDRQQEEELDRAANVVLEEATREDRGHREDGERERGRVPGAAEDWALHAGREAGSKDS